MYPEHYRGEHFYMDHSDSDENCYFPHPCYESEEGEVEDEERVEGNEKKEEEGGWLIIEKRFKSTMLRNIRRIKRFVRVHISPFSNSLEKTIFYGKRINIEFAIEEFYGKFSANFS